MSLHPVYRITHIGRPLEPQYPTNLAILVLMPLVGAIAAVLRWQGGAEPAAIAAAFLLAGLTVFMTWAFARELAPDDNPAAFFAVALVLAPLLCGAELDLLTPAILTALVRVVNRTVGPPSKKKDLLAVLLGVSILVFAKGAWLYGWIAALALWLDTRLGLSGERTRPFAAFAVVIALIGLSLALDPVFPDDCVCACPQLVPAALAVTVLFLFATATQREPRSCCDMNAWPLSRERVQGGMLIGLLGALASVGGGPEGVLQAAPLWAAIAGVVIGRPLLRFRK